MARSRKDGRHGGGHRNTQGAEVWSARCPLVRSVDRDAKGWKRVTHRWERRDAKRALRDADDPTF